MKDNYRKLIIKIGMVLVFLMVANFLIMMFLGMSKSHGLVPVVPNPIAKAGSVFPIATIVFGAALIIVLLYWLISRLVSWLSQKGRSKLKARYNVKGRSH